MATLSDHSLLLSDLLQNMHVQLERAHYTHCYPEWQEIDYVPDFSKFYLICAGEGTIEVNGQQLYPIAGQLCLMPAYTKQSYSVINSNTYQKYWCHFQATMGGLDLFQWIKSPICLTLGEHFGQFQSLFAALSEAHANPSLISRIREKAILLEIIALFFEKTEHQLEFVPHRSQDWERLQMIEQFIEEHFDQPVTLEQMARHVHLHPNYLVRCCNKYFSLPPLKYLNRKRMHKARELLRTTTLAVKEVAEQTGFSDTNHFAKVFRREYSCSPSQYRMQSGNTQ